MRRGAYLAMKMSLLLSDVKVVSPMADGRHLLSNGTYHSCHGWRGFLTVGIPELAGHLRCYPGLVGGQHLIASK